MPGDLATGKIRNGDMIMSETQATATATDFDAERQRISDTLFGWASTQGYRNAGLAAIEAAGLPAPTQPRETAVVTAHVTGTVNVRCDYAGNVTQDAVVRALASAVANGTAVVEFAEVDAA